MSSVSLNSITASAITTSTISLHTGLGASGQEWKRGTVTLVSNGTYPTKASTVIADELKYYQVGKMVTVVFMYNQLSNAGASAGFGIYGIGLPVEAKAGPLGEECVGTCRVQSGARVLSGNMILGSSTFAYMEVGDDTTPMTYVSNNDFDVETVGKTQYTGSFTYEAL